MTDREFKDITFHHLANVINAFASPKRLEIIDLLSQGEKDVDTLTKEGIKKVVSQKVEEIYKNKE